MLCADVGSCLATFAQRWLRPKQGRLSLRPVQPDRDRSLSNADADRTQPTPSLAETGRRLIRKDGLHLGDSGADKRAREEQGRESGLLALIASASHELRSPLQSIQGFADLLAAESYGALGDEQRVFVEHIIHGSADLSRVLDACFELVQAELTNGQPRLGPVLFRRALEDSITLARSATEVVVDSRFGQVPEELTIEADSYGLARAVGAIVTALAPASRGPLLITASLRDSMVEVLFGPSSSDLPSGWRSIQELSRKGLSARALLWLGLASALLLKGGARLEASEGYDRIRILLPAPSGA